MEFGCNAAIAKINHNNVEETAMKKPIILRKRYIPDEVIDISGDELVFRSEDLLITKWNPIRKRPDISGGISFTFLKEGYKASKFSVRPASLSTGIAI